MRYFSDEELKEVIRYIRRKRPSCHLVVGTVTNGTILAIYDGLYSEVMLVLQGENMRGVDLSDDCMYIKKALRPWDYK